MRAAVALAALAVFLLGEPACAYNRHWRLGASYARLTDGGARSLFGDAWAVVGEYSFTDQLTEDDDIPDDVSLAIQFRRFDNTIPGVNYTVDYASYGLKWRKGPGAAPECDGFYGGIGLAAAMVRIKPAVYGGGAGDGDTRFEWTLFGGCNFARCLYAEFGYSQIPKVNNVAFGQILFTIGGRF